MASFRLQHLMFIVVLLLVALLGPSISSAEASQKSEASIEMRLLDSWQNADAYLPQNAAGNDWREFLLMSELRQQVSRGASADPDQVARILKRFQNDNAFLRTEQFLVVREILSEWLPTLDALHPEDAAQLAQDIAADFQPPAASEVQVAIKEMQAVSKEMDRFLAAHPEVRPGWEAYFAWDKWQAEMQRSDQPDPTVLTSVANRLQSAAEIFPDPICQKAARILRSGAREVYRAQTTPEEAQKWLDKVAHLLQIPPSEFTTANAEALVEANVWLERRDLGGRLLAAALALHSRPNFRLAVSHRMLALGVDTPINSTNPFTDNIQGTTYRGTSRTQGNVSLELLPNPRQIALQLSCQLAITSSSTGTNQRATVQSGSTTNVTGKKLVTLDSAGLHIYPARANAGTRSQIYGVQSSGFLGRRRVNSGAQEGKAATEQEVSRLSENRLEAELDRESARFLAPFTRTLKNDLRRSLILVDGFPQQMRTWSTPEFAYMMITQAGVAQLGAPHNAPGVREPSDLMLQFHESFVSNMGDSLLAGKTYGDQEFQSLWESLFGAGSGGLQNTDPNNPWRITFSREHPLQIKVDSGKLVILVRAETFYVGADSYPAMNITAHYDLDTNGIGMVATRTGRLEIDPPNLKAGERISARISALRTMIRKRFDPVFPESWEAKTFQLATHSNQKPEVKIRKVIAEDGWITLAGEMVSVPVVGQAGQSPNTR